MTSHERSIDVAHRARVVYDHGFVVTFPRFMDGVESVTQDQSPSTCIGSQKWKALQQEDDTEIVELIPDQRIVWKSTSGPEHAGVATFHGLGDGSTRVILKIKPRVSSTTVWTLLASGSSFTREVQRVRGIQVFWRTGTVAGRGIPETYRSMAGSYSFFFFFFFFFWRSGSGFDGRSVVAAFAGAVD